MLKLYKNPQLYNAGGDLTKRWFVFYSFVNPNTDRFERRRVYFDINAYKTKSERTEYGNLMIKRINALLEKGYTPFKLTADQDQATVPKTLAQAVDFYLSVKASSIRPKTALGYKSILGFLSRYAASAGWSARTITTYVTADLQTYLDDARQTRRIGNTTFNAELAALRVFFEFLKERQLLTINPAKAIKRLREESVRHHAYSDVLVTRITEHLRSTQTARADQMLVFIQCVYYACLRPAEAARLLLQHVDLPGQTITVPGNIAKTGRTGTIELSAGLVDALAPLLVDQNGQALPGDYYLFGNQASGANRCDPGPGQKPTGHNYFTKYYRLLMRELGLGDEYTIYGWKHTRNIHLFKDGVDIYRIMRHNRHTSLDMTQKYLRDLGLHLDTQLGDTRRL